MFFLNSFLKRENLYSWLIPFVPIKGENLYKTYQGRHVRGFRSPLGDFSEDFL